MTRPLKRPTFAVLAPFAPALVVLATSYWAAGCARGSADVRTAQDVEIDLDRRNAERIARYYLGGFVGAEGGDPIRAGMLSVEGSTLTLHPHALPDYARASLEDGGDGVLDRDEFGRWASAAYRRARALPPTLDSLRAGQPPWANSDSTWFTFDVQGSTMTHARRRLLVRVSSLRAAIQNFVARGQLEYPDGTLLIGEHLVDGAVVETTVKRRRADGFWDFMVYDGAGGLAEATSTPPRTLRAPFQCTGCHLGSRLFEPDRSFPGEAPDGPAGARGVLVPSAWRDAGAAAIFREHATRADAVLGLYATLYVARLRAERAAGRPLPPVDDRLLQALEHRADVR